ncbi:DUF4160 domain-containing protein [cf. Phormidesmis sp. LEGE 11477]|uniref:DUF4160 domain-containing protein n=1 Tax=cf. Phormidesmis sp. LEGE 11477 TaxID=1828680 RepID=UPI0018814607|nr:DUF4160 domain-containing protein [cf. Phormidesmis sp. LEGE 11477]
MPTVWTNGSIYITVYVKDHQPPHVHVSDSDNEVKVDISSDVPALMRRSKKERINSNKKFDKAALKLVAEHIVVCKEVWRLKHNGE